MITFSLKIKHLVVKNKKYTQCNCFFQSMVKAKEKLRVGELQTKIIITLILAT